MCTLTLAWRVFPDAPLVVAANRDEATDRPSSAPATRSLESDDSQPDGTRILAPRDERAGGTWIGVNEHDVFAGITNRWTDTDLAGDRSRGLLVGDALREESAEAAATTVRESVADIEYDGFNLVLADAASAVLLEWDGSLVERRFDPGVHVVVNVGADDDFTIPSFRSDIGEQQATNARRAREELAVREAEDVEAWLERARTVLGDHDFGLCIHGDGYGTRSASVVVLRDPGVVEYEYADGPPCETAFQPVVHDL